MSETVGADLSVMPEEMRQAIFEFLPPETLQDVRESGGLLRDSVDSYVQHLLDARMMSDADGREVPAGTDPADALARWASGAFGTDAYPVHAPPIDPDAVREKYDGSFFTYSADDSWQSTILTGAYDRVIDGGGMRALEIRAELEEYARQKAAEGMVVDADRDPVPPDTSPDVVLNGIRDRTMRFLP